MPILRPINLDPDKLIITEFLLTVNHNPRILWLVAFEAALFRQGYTVTAWYSTVVVPPFGRSGRKY